MLCNVIPLGPSPCKLLLPLDSELCCLPTRCHISMAPTPPPPPPPPLPVLITSKEPPLQVLILMDNPHHHHYHHCHGLPSSQWPLGLVRTLHNIWLSNWSNRTLSKAPLVRAPPNEIFLFNIPQALRVSRCEQVGTVNKQARQFPCKVGPNLTFKTTRSSGFT